MVEEAQKNLIKNNFSKNLITKGDFENPKFIKDNSVDCIIGLGTFYYSKKLNHTLRNQLKKLKKNGRLIFSLRNELFDIATFNEYSENFFSQLYEIKSKDNYTKKKFKKIFKEYFKSKSNMQKNIDQKKVYSSRHNPLTFEKNFCQTLNIKLNGIYYYHFHSLPPFFEKENRLKFRKDSIKLENPNDWRGIFLASGFVVDCSKK
jgi:SAM-dependent methyltransferase